MRCSCMCVFMCACMCDRCSLKDVLCYHAFRRLSLTDFSVIARLLCVTVAVCRPGQGTVRCQQDSCSVSHDVQAVSPLLRARILLPAAIQSQGLGGHCSVRGPGTLGSLDNPTLTGHHPPDLVLCVWSWMHTFPILYQTVKYKIVLISKNRNVRLDQCKVRN